MTEGFIKNVKDFNETPSHYNLHKSFKEDFNVAKTKFNYY